MKHEPENKSKYQNNRYCSRNINGIIPITIARSINQSYKRDIKLSFLWSISFFIYLRVPILFFVCKITKKRLYSSNLVKEKHKTKNRMFLFYDLMIIFVV